ncbi:hypothetical protein GDO81_001367 [Engystomops pustulosus]|uniref:Ig-like domain-containing protein n=2 Tax=Engystomops pustulosus TaxID=76066 RepID=A0AAV7DCG2_ENGPU|nr:hypothetical protein GDO81_001367 [Engystomops pustulosus]
MPACHPVLLLTVILKISFTFGATEWTSWFNVDHPEGDGDYETIEAIRFYYPQRLCLRPIALEARTIEWATPKDTKEIVHSNPEKGFWCINKEQQRGQNCSNYHVRFQCRLDPLFWSHWSPWSTCSQTGCGAKGIQIRRRTCISARPEISLSLEKCRGEGIERRVCITQPCILGKWSSWSTWTPCTKTCGEGKSVRQRKCSSNSMPCSGPSFQIQKCRTSPCTKSSCSVCNCANHTLVGKVQSIHGFAQSNASIFMNGRIQGITDHHGMFSLKGVCKEVYKNITVTMQGFSSGTLQTWKNESNISYFQAILNRLEQPYMVQHPYSKIRKEGHKVTFCCEAIGNPIPSKYYWYHNGTLLDKNKIKYDKSLILQNIHAAQAGTYQCKASNGFGIIKSSMAHLTVIGKSKSYCDELPQEHFIKLPTECFNTKTSSNFFNVGKCSNSQCVGHLNFDQQCKDKVDYCCGVKRLKLQEVNCSGYTLPIMLVVECGCAQCTQHKVLVRGRVTAYDTGSPLQFGQIFINGENIGFTGYKGEFTLEVPVGTKRLVVTFVDPQERFVDSLKIIPFDPKGNTIYQDIKIMRKKEPFNLNTSLTNIIPLGEVFGEDPIGELIIPPNSFTRINGESYRGTVKASLTFLDPRNISTASAASSDLNFVNRNGDISPLRTYGMFAVDFREKDTNSMLYTRKVEVRLDTEHIKMPQHLKEMKLWSLNPQTGIWEEENSFYLEGEGKRKKREERSFLIGQLEIRERRLFNLDVPEFRRCFVKVRAYMNEKFLPNEQVEGVVVTLINLEPMQGFSSNPRAWGRFDSVITGRNGACLPAFCDAQQSNAYSAYVTALMGGEELEAVASSPKLNPNVIGVSQPYLSKLNYQRTDHEDSAGKKTAFRFNIAKPNPNNLEETSGPIYAYRNLRACEEASFLDNHFRFYRVEEDKFEYNTVPFVETDMTSWIGSYLSWWPNPQEFRACYLKVQIQGQQEYMVRSRNIGGIHIKTVGQLYGLRDIRSVRDMSVEGTSAACLEFKCSGKLYDQDLLDRTLVTVIPQGSCHVVEVNRLLEDYLKHHPPLALGNNTGVFNMLAPFDPLGHNYGIYTVTDQNPRLAKEIAIGRCFDGTSDGFSREMRSQVGVAITFRCQEKPITKESFFQRLLNNPGDTLREIRRDMQENQQRETTSRIIPYPASGSLFSRRSKQPFPSLRRTRQK